MLFHLKILAGFCSDSQKLGTVVGAAARAKPRVHLRGIHHMCIGPTRGGLPEPPTTVWGGGGFWQDGGVLGWTRVKQAAESTVVAAVFIVQVWESQNY